MVTKNLIGFDLHIIQIILHKPFRFQLANLTSKLQN
jgi:hypothetical protein